MSPEPADLYSPQSTLTCAADSPLAIPVSLILYLECAWPILLAGLGLHGGRLGWGAPSQWSDMGSVPQALPAYVLKVTA